MRLVTLEEFPELSNRSRKVIYNKAYFSDDKLEWAEFCALYPDNPPEWGIQISYTYTPSGESWLDGHGGERETTVIRSVSYRWLSQLATTDEPLNWHLQALKPLAVYLVRRLDHCNRLPQKRFEKLDLAAEAFNFLHALSETANENFFSPSDREKWSRLRARAKNLTAGAESNELEKQFDAVHAILVATNKFFDATPQLILGGESGLYYYDQFNSETHEKSIRLCYKDRDEPLLVGYHYKDLKSEAEKREDKSQHWKARSIAYVCYYLHERLKLEQFNIGSAQTRYTKIQFANKVLNFLKQLPEEIEAITEEQRQEWKGFCVQAKQDGGDSCEMYLKPIQHIVNFSFVTQQSQDQRQYVVISAVEDVILRASDETGSLEVELSYWDFGISKTIRFNKDKTWLREAALKDDVISPIANYILTRTQPPAGILFLRFEKLELARDVLVFLDKLSPREPNDKERSEWEKLYQRAKNSRGILYEVIKTTDQKLFAQFGGPNPENELYSHELKNVGLRLFNATELSYFSGGDSKFGLAAQLVILPAKERLEKLEQPENRFDIKSMLRWQLAKYLLAVVYYAAPDFEQTAEKIGKKVSGFGDFHQRFRDIRTANKLFELYEQAETKAPEQFSLLLLIASTYSGLEAGVGRTLTEYLSAAYVTVAVQAPTITG